MGSSSSTENNSTGKALGDEILQIIISELQKTIENSNANGDQEKAASEKKTNEIILLQEKFTEYRKLVEEANNQKTEQMRSDTLQLQNSLEEYKQKLDKINKEKQDLERKFDNQKELVCELNTKCNKTEKNLNTECELRQSLEKDLMQMNTLKREFETQTKKVRELESELDKTKNKLQDEIKSRQELETKLNCAENVSKPDTTKILRDTIDKQGAIIKQVQETLKETQKKLDSEQKNKREEYEYKKLLEKDIQIKTLEMEYETQSKKVGELRRELANTKINLQNEIKLKTELETKLKCGEYTSKYEPITLQDTIEKQAAIIKQVQNNLNGTQQTLDSVLKNKREESIKFEIEKQEKEYLMNKLRTTEAEAEKERSKIKQKFEEQEKQIKDVTAKLTAAQKTNRQQMKLKKKAQAELTVFEENNNTIKQLEEKLEEKDRILMEYLKTTPKKTQEGLNELQMEIALSNFLKISEEARAKELEMKNVEHDDLKLKYESNLQEQFRRFNRIVYKLKMTEKERDQRELLRQETEGKLNLLEISYSSIKKFCEKELREGKDFLEEFEKFKQLSKASTANLEEASKSIEPDPFLIEKMAFEAQLDSKTNEIAFLKQQLKQKETEIQNMACEGHSNNKRSDMAKLHEEFMENLKKFNQN